jgi:hypothetical protein
MQTTIFVIILATVTLASFALGGVAERRKVRRAWERGEKTWMGLKEEENRNIDDGYDLRR